MREINKDLKSHFRELEAKVIALSTSQRTSVDSDKENCFE
jgi:replicative DNA helicase